MAVPKRFNLGGEEVDGIEVEFETQKEPWTEVQLADGGRFRMRLTVQRVYKVHDLAGQPLKDAEGRQRLLVESKNELVIHD